MSADGGRPRAAEPEELGRMFVERANARDLDGLVALYEPGAVLAGRDGPAVGQQAIRARLAEFLASAPTLTGTARPAVRHGDLALTSTGFPGGATAEVARRQPDGSWLWVIDQPRVLPGS